MASFSAASALVTLGAICLFRSRTLPQYTLSVIPVMLAIQQASEGLVWLSKLDSGYRQSSFFPMYIFLVFAQAVWPFYIPFSVYLFESSPSRKKSMFALMILGLFTGLYLLYGILHYPVTSVIEGSHIKYILPFPGDRLFFIGIFYFVSTACTPFFSSHALIRVSGIIIALSNFFTLLFFPHHVVSVWCYFAAAISIVILVFILRETRPGYIQSNLNAER